MDTTRKILAGAMGILVLVVVILAARWTGEQIRSRYFNKPTPPLTVTITEPVVETTKTASYSATPKTGPNEMTLILLTGSLISGASLIYSSKRSLIK